MVENINFGAQKLADKVDPTTLASDQASESLRLELALHRSGHGQGARIEPLPPWKPDPFCWPPIDPICRDDRDPFPWENKPKPKPPRRRK